MTLGLQIVAGWMAFVAFFGLALLAWGDKTGQFENAEDAKYIPFREREPEDWPGRKSSSRGV